MLRSKLVKILWKFFTVIVTVTKKILLLSYVNLYNINVQIILALFSDPYIVQKDYRKNHIDTKLL